MRRIRKTLTYLLTYRPMAAVFSERNYRDISPHHTIGKQWHLSGWLTVCHRPISAETIRSHTPRGTRTSYFGPLRYQHSDDQWNHKVSLHMHPEEPERLTSYQFRANLLFGTSTSPIRPVETYRRTLDHIKRKITHFLTNSTAAIIPPIGTKTSYFRSHKSGQYFFRQRGDTF